jgi:site-specific DNA recombinase
MNLDHFKKLLKPTKIEELVNLTVWDYSRVSSKEQEQNRSIDVQKAEANKYAEKHGYTIGMSFGATYESASGDFTRREFMKLIETVRKSKKKPFAILIYTMSRFSRSGGSGIALAHELVDELGVHLIEVTTGKNTMTEEGKLEIYQGLIRSRQDNLDRLKVTVPGMKKMLQAGHALGRVPKGYVHYGPRVKDIKYFAPTQRIEFSDEAPMIRKAWDWKLQGVSCVMIRSKLEELSVKMSKQQISKMWRNPFYCGVNTNKLLGEDIVEGNWPRMVTEKEFMRVQEILKGNKFGYKNELSNRFRPLSGFACCSKCGRKMSGYEVLAKGLHYYKCQVCKDATISTDGGAGKRSKGKSAHQLFIEELAKYTQQPGNKKFFEMQLELTYASLEREQKKDVPLIKKRLEKLQSDMKNLQRKFAVEGLDKNLYLEFKAELDIQINDVMQELEKSQNSVSNLNKFISSSSALAQNLSNYWVSGGIELKKRVQQLVFPEGVVIDTKNRVLLTKKVNSVFNITAHLPRLPEGVNENSRSKNDRLSPSVAGDGFEPTTFGL